MIPPKFEYFAPSTLPEALALLSGHGEDAKLLAGGQSLLSLLKLRLARPKVLVDLGRIPGLSYVREDGAAGAIAIGALTTYAEIKASRVLTERCPLLPQTAAVVGDVQVRNRGTLGGSLAHADPAADMPAAILALGGDVKAVGPRGERWIPAEAFFRGMFATALAPDEILTEVRLPAAPGRKGAYLKAARRPSDFALVGVAVCLRVGPGGICEEVALGVTGLADRPFRAKGVEERLRGRRLEPGTVEEAAATIAQGVEVTDSIHGSGAYRAHLARVYAARGIRAAR